MSRPDTFSLTIQDNTTSSRWLSGLAYLRNGRVQVNRQDEWSASFHVQGSRKYNVKLQWGHTDHDILCLLVSCSCPDYYELQYLCKHLVACVKFLEMNNGQFRKTVEESTEHAIDTDFGLFCPRTSINQSFPWDVASQLTSGPTSGQISKPASELKSADKVTMPAKVISRERQRLNSLLGIFNAPRPSSLQLKKPSRDSTTLSEIWYELCLDQLTDDGSIRIRLHQKILNLSTGKFSTRKSFESPIADDAFAEINFLHSCDIENLKRFTAFRPVKKIYSWQDNDAISKVRDIDFNRDTALSELFKLGETGRLFVTGSKKSSGEFPPIKDTVITPNNNGAFDFCFEVNSTELDSQYALKGYLKSPAGASIKFDDIGVITEIFCLTINCALIKINEIPGSILNLVGSLIDDGPLTGSKSDLSPLIRSLESLLHPSLLILPEELQSKRGVSSMKPRLSFLKTPEILNAERVFVCLTMNYEGKSFDIDDPQISWLTGSGDNETLFLRQPEVEQQAAHELFSASEFLHPESGNRGNLTYHATVKRDKIVDVALKALSTGWLVDFEGKALTKADKTSLVLSSGIDWFDINCEASFGGETLRGRDLLRAAVMQSGFIHLSDGTLGVIDDMRFQRNLERLHRFAGSTHAKSLQISKLHALILELEEAASQNISYDKHAHEFIKNAQSAKSIVPVSPPSTFRATLRPYQAEGLGWLQYLKSTGFGGCLADDMGLGKTVQVLACLDDHHLGLRKAKTRRTSIVIAPKSLIFNWQSEAKKFAPNLRVVILEKGVRQNIVSACAEADLVLASYQITRAELKDLLNLEFEYVILDEAHYIKNRDSQISKSVKLLACKHRLALTGTPIENRLDDLISIFEFLNPTLGGFDLFKRAKSGLTGSKEDQMLLAEVLRPFLLRRTKSQVLKDLPPKTETIIYCDLSDDERHSYDSIAKAIREDLNGEIESRGIKKSQIQILAALTRLRQSACHPGLVDKKLKSITSTKVDVLLDKIKETLAEGEKVLIFSQFTELLKIAASRFESEGIGFNYLDGQTRDREAVVQNFNSDEGPSVFLISLKAGGVGLNLTAASNCFLLDPWWNPAAESQAIDRAHRIGQTKPVFAYKLIARGTVEEKILTLQLEKKNLAATVLGQNEGAPRALSLTDLEMLLA